MFRRALVLLGAISLMSYAALTSAVLAQTPLPQPLITPGPSATNSPPPRLSWPGPIANVDYYCRDQFIGDQNRELNSYIESNDWVQVLVSGKLDGQHMDQCLQKYEHPYFALMKIHYYVRAALGEYRRSGLTAEMIRYEEIAISAARIVDRFQLPAIFTAMYQDDMAAIDGLSKKRR